MILMPCNADGLPDIAETGEYESLFIRGYPYGKSAFNIRGHSIAFRAGHDRHSRYRLAVSIQYVAGNDTIAGLSIPAAGSRIKGYLPVADFKGYGYGRQHLVQSLVYGHILCIQRDFCREIELCSIIKEGVSAYRFDGR